VPIYSELFKVPCWWSYFTQKQTTRFQNYHDQETLTNGIWESWGNERIGIYCFCSCSFLPLGYWCPWSSFPLFPLIFQLSEIEIIQIWGTTQETKYVTPTFFTKQFSNNIHFNSKFNLKLCLFLFQCLNKWKKSNYNIDSMIYLYGNLVRNLLMWMGNFAFNFTSGRNSPHFINQSIHFISPRPFGHILYCISDIQPCPRQNKSFPLQSLRDKVRNNKIKSYNMTFVTLQTKQKRVQIKVISISGMFIYLYVDTHSFVAGCLTEEHTETGIRKHEHCHPILSHSQSISRKISKRRSISDYHRIKTQIKKKNKMNNYECCDL